MSFERRIKEILEARMNGTASEEDLTTLEKWLDRSPANRELIELIDGSEGLFPLLERLYSYDGDRVWNNIRRVARRQRRVNLGRSAIKYAVVAAVMAFVGGVGWWSRDRLTQESARQASIEYPEPGVRGAVLTLSTGERVALDRGGSRMLIERDGTRIAISDEEAAYPETAAGEEITERNTITVPRGREFSLRLSDGTQVWLNSESSLTFPVRFGRGSREVSVTGEAYFEVAYDLTRRFVVRADTVTVSVYGTGFNISAYPDESIIETTLLHGSVEVASGRRRVMLEPGQQAHVGREGAIFDVRGVHAEDYASWIYGHFTFTEDTLEAICLKLSRWYDVEIVPRGDAGKVRYSGVVKRYADFGQMARLLERTNQIKTDIHDGKIVLYIDRDGS